MTKFIKQAEIIAEAKRDGLNKFTGIKVFNISLAFIYQLWYREKNNAQGMGIK